MLNAGVAPWPLFTEEEVEAVSAVLRSGKVNYWTGTIGREFEQDFAGLTGCRHAVALFNGTVALDLALKALDVGPGDEVIVTPRTFIASVSCVVNAGATPIFADVDINSGNLSAETIERVLTHRTKAVICVHLAGWPCDMDAIMELSRQQSFFVIEDCAQAHGAMYRGRSVGSIGQIGAWSFCQDKIVTTGGEGGMVTTNDADLWSSMWSFKDHGKSWKAVYDREHRPGFRWVHESFGTNWRMLEIQAAIGRIQLRRLPEWTRRRTQVAGRYAEVASRHSHALRTPMPDDESVHAYYRFYTYVRPEALKTDWTRDRIVAEVTAKGVPILHGTCSEVYQEKAFSGTSYRPESRLPVARDLGETSMMFLTHPTLGDDEVDRICAAVDDVMREASR